MAPCCMALGPLGAARFYKLRQQLAARRHCMAAAYMSPTLALMLLAQPGVHLASKHVGVGHGVLQLRKLALQRGHLQGYVAAGELEEGT